MELPLIRSIYLIGSLFCKSIAQVHQHGLDPIATPTTLKFWIQWIGNFHPIILHFPIALIVMTGFAELCNAFKPSHMFQNAARFMLFFAAVTALPTALLGLAYATHESHDGSIFLIFWWHRFTGIATAVLAIIVCILKELQFREKIKPVLYFIFLIGLIALITVTGFLGGEMTFGIGHLIP